MGILRNVLNWYARLTPGRGKRVPPFQHVVQVGDPRLRQVCEMVPLERIRSPEVQNVINKLFYVLKAHDSIGMSAPQIGVNLRIFVISIPKKTVKSMPARTVKEQGITHIPPTVFINPKMKIVNFDKVVFTEGCESMKGYAANVPRYKTVEITARDEEGEVRCLTLNDYSARVVQHEMDHLDGKLFIDIMDTRSLHCVCWEEINLSQGRVVLPFRP